MAINIKNERTVALARELAAARGVTLTSAIEEALEARLAAVRESGAYLDADLDADRAKRLKEIEQLVREIQANVTDAQRAALATAESDLYDELGLPA